MHPAPRKRKQPLPTKLKRCGAKKRAADADTLPKRKPSADLLKTVLTSLEDAKAEDLVTLDIDGKAALADHMVIASGRSNRHVSAISDQLVDALKKSGYRDLRIEGLPLCDWVLIDTGDVIAHVFRPEVRSFYNLEKLWSANAPADQAAG